MQLHFANNLCYSLIIKNYIKKERTFGYELEIIKYLEKNGLEYKDFGCNGESVDYPIYIGYNGVIIRADLVNNAFCKLERYFETVYFDCVYFENSTYPNIVVYQFRAYNQLNNDISKTRLLSLIQNVAEEVLTLHFREMGCYIPVDNFIAVSLSNDLLRIAIAKNPKGFAEIYQLRRK